MLATTPALGAARRGLALGLHLNLTEGPPIAPARQVASLIQPQTPWWPSGTIGAGDSGALQGNLGSQVEHMRGKGGLREALSKCQISLEEVGTEVQAQIAAFKQLTGAPPAYLDGHQHVHVLPGIAAVVARIAASEGVTFVRIPDERPEHFEGHVGAARTAFYRTVTSQASDARHVMSDEGLVAPHSFIGLGLMGADLTQERLLQRLQALLHDAHASTCCPPKHPASGGACARRAAWGGEHVHVCEYMCHVGRPSAQGDDFSKSHDRLWELQQLTLPDVRQWIACNGIDLTSYQGLAATTAQPRLSLTASSIPSPRSHSSSANACQHRGLEDKGPRDPTDDKATQGFGGRALPDVQQCNAYSEEGRQREAKGRSRVQAGGGGTLLILSSMTPATGNATTALRFAAMARQHGWQVECADVGEVQDASELRAILHRLHVTAVLGVHAFRAGRLLLQCKQDMPYAIVLGGTDVNVRVLLLLSMCNLRRLTSAASWWRWRRCG